MFNKGLLFQSACKMGRAKFKLVWFVSESVDNLTREAFVCEVMCLNIV